MNNAGEIVRDMVECAECEAFAPIGIWNERKIETRFVVRYLHNGCSTEVWPSTEANARAVFDEFARRSPEALPHLVKKTISTAENVLQHIERTM